MAVWVRLPSSLQINIEMENFTFKGKTIEELEQEVVNAEGLDENGNPKWWKAQADLEDAVVFKKLFARGKKVKEEWEQIKKRLI